MYTFREITGVISNKQKGEILELVGSNAENISAYVVHKNSPFYEYVRVREIVRAAMFLDFLKNDENTCLIVAEDSGKVIGYLLYNRDITYIEDVSVCSTVVSEKYRHQGIFTNMINLLKRKSNSISLSCFINKVSFYQKHGFRIDGLFETQVGMCYGMYIGEGLFASVDDDILESHPLVIEELKKVQSSLGKSFGHKYKRFLLENKKEKEKVEKIIIINNNSQS